MNENAQTEGPSAKTNRAGVVPSRAAEVVEVSAQFMVNQLMQGAAMTATEISEALGARVGRRTIYRWAKGDSAPQQPSDLAELSKLYAQKCSA
jgi:hypothetical protein